MVVVAQLVRVAVCGAAGRRFEPGQPPRNVKSPEMGTFFVCVSNHSPNFVMLTKEASPLS